MKKIRNLTVSKFDSIGLTSLIPGMLDQWVSGHVKRGVGGGSPDEARQVGANPIPIPHPTNLVLFGHKITLDRFNQGAHTIAGGQIGAGVKPPAPSL